ncbi:hypothetical protein [Microbacterium sp.]|uniref:hypothetical protein n=1 Tax=Microbacterium sp. TaxID=51671 RepID=UPI0026170B0B|nr:hypothetical protein [Microbacterium sp.]
MNDESRPVGGSRNSAGGRMVQVQDTVTRFLSGDLQPHELPWDLWRVWADGFHAGCARVTPRVERANREADHWYYVANNPAEVRAEHERTLKAFDVMQARKAVSA